MHGADAAAQALEADARESGGTEPLREPLRLGEGQHRLWQVGIGVPMFRHQPTDGGENSPEIEQVNRAQRREPGRGELEDNEARTRFQHSCCLAQSAVEIGQIANAKSHQGAVEPRRGKRQLQRVGGDRNGAGSLVFTLRQHRNREVGADHSAAKADLPR